MSELLRFPLSRVYRILFNSTKDVLMKPRTPETVAAIKAGRLLPGMTFNERVWVMCARIPAGRVTTYGKLARALGSNGARAVGNALNHNPYSPKVPCHRVVGSDGSLTGFAGGLPKKQRMLAREGVIFRGNKVDLASAEFKFPIGAHA
jgi:methylated-DNA-[protein]-cysteine S-methyltransferase